jgi:hypothetical protein
VKVFSILCVGILLFGCASQPPASGVGPTQNAGAANQQGSGSNAQQAGQSLGLMIASGQAFDCDYTDVQTGSTMNYKGKGGKLRVETTSQGGTVTVIAESASQTTYTNMGPEISGLGCDWIKSTAQDIGETEGQGYERINQQVQNVREGQLVCRTPSFSDAIFTPVGSVCTMDEFKQKVSAAVPQ